MPVTIPSITGGIVEYYAGPTATFAVKTGQTVTGGDLVELTAAMEVQAAGAGSEKVVGVAMHDADPAGEIKKVTVWLKGAVLPLKANGAITAGDLVESAAAGDVSTVAASGGAYVQGEANNYRQLVGLALESISNAATGKIMVFGT